MRYDQESFLSGIAVGRNLASWPIGEGMDIFEFTVRVAYAGATFYSPWIVFNGVIEWGDDSTSSFANIPQGWEAYDEQRKQQSRDQATHVYSSPGDYSIRMVGDLRDFSITQIWSVGLSQTDTTLVSIDTPFPETMLGRDAFPAIFRGCQNLVSLPRGLFSKCNAKNLIYMCVNCTSLESIPDDLLYGASEITNMWGTFCNCGLTRIPPSLFAWTPNVTIINELFRRCSHITEIPIGLLDTLANLTEVIQAFKSTGITSIPRGLFFNNPEIIQFDHTFEYTPIISIPDDLFINCTNAISFWYTFAYTSNLATIPETLFATCQSAENFSSTFRNSGITSIPNELFTGCPLANNFLSCFEDCEDVTGPVPELWVAYPNIRNHGSCFDGCINASNYDDIPDDWK